MAFYKSLFGTALGFSQPDGSLVTGAKRMERMGKLLYLNKVASTAISASSTETLFDTFATIKGGILAPGSLLKIRYQGIATATNSTDTLAIKLYFGGLAGVALTAMAATDVADSNVFQGEYELAIRTIGASGTMVGLGLFKSIPAAEGTATIKDDILASTAVDTTISNVIGVSATWSTTNAGNSVRLDFMRVEHW